MNFIRTTAAEVPIGGKLVRVEIVRNSWWCDVLNKEFFIFGKTLYIKNKVLTRKVFMAGLSEMMRRYKIGYIRYYWNVLTK